MYLEALRLEEVWQVLVGVITVAVVAPQRAENLVGWERQPHVGKYVAELIEAPEEMIGPFKSLLRVAFSAEEPNLPGIVRGDAGDPGQLALVGDRNDCIRRRRPDHEVDLVIINQLSCYFGGTIW